jgi:acetylornithine deacetylase
MHIDTARTTDYLRAMVAIDSVNPGLVAGAAGEGAMARWLAETCAALGLEVTLDETAPGRPNVIGRWRGAGSGSSLLLTGHTDIVSTENMTRPPFEAVVEGGRLYGRGAYDMKGGLAAILGAVEALRREGFTPTGDIWLGFVTDEEYLSIGTDALVQRIQPDAAILTEPTGMALCVAHKGFAWLTIQTEGLAAHGSLYDVGVDAVAHMGRVLALLERMEREILPRRDHPLVGRPSVHASTIAGGLGLSTYPDRCTLQVEHRLLPDETAEDALALWRAGLAALHAADPRFKASVELYFYRPGYEIDQAAPIVRALHTAYAEVVGREPEYMGQRAWLDSAILGRAGIPTVILGPKGEGAHAAVEWVDLESVWSCAAVLARCTKLV